MGFLSDVVVEVRRRLERAPIDQGRLAVLVASMPPTRAFGLALRFPPAHPAVIAEVKRASPSVGPIADRDPARQARAYEDGGAAAVSVLTEPLHFGGALADLRAVRLATSLPVLRKDFLVHPAQVLESRAAGADAVLLIAAALPGPELPAMLAAARELGLDALVEVHAEADLARAVDAGADLIGVNARDLETLEVDGERALRLVRSVPPDRVAVLESGIASPEQVGRAVEAGARAVLVGEHLMRAPDPAAALRALVGRA
jgi:indole-3-glycerol phosphate synthase